MGLKRAQATNARRLLSISLMHRILEALRLSVQRNCPFDGDSRGQQIANRI